MGSYTAEAGGAGLGIHVFDWDGSRLTARSVYRTASPSYLVTDGEVLFAVNEGADGTVSSHALDGTPLSTQPTGGAGPAT